jgi:hypothetical protein
VSRRGARHSRSLRCLAIDPPASVGVRVDRRRRASAPCPCASGTSTPHAPSAVHANTLNVADVSRLHPMLCHQPELVSYAPIAHWCAAWLPRLASLSFEQRISRQRQTHRKRELNWRVQKIFLKRVNDLMLHFVIGLRSVKDNLCSPMLHPKKPAVQDSSKATV